VRVSLTGSCRGSSLLRERQDALFEEVAALAAGLGDIWLERVTLDFQSTGGGCRGDEPTSSFQGLIDSLSGDGIELEEIILEMPELGELKSKLPPAVTSGEDAFDPTDPRFLHTISQEVADLLLGRLMRQGGDE
jgi:DNA repair protein SbcD/Mre11